MAATHGAVYLIAAPLEWDPGSRVVVPANFQRVSLRLTASCP
jgi:hypothetical protein